MTTRAKSGIVKPKVYHIQDQFKCMKEPDSVSEALAIPEWRSAMQTEFDALIDNQT